MSGFLLNPYIYSQAVVTDPYWANVKNLIGFENGFIDEKTGVTWSLFNSPAVSTTSPKFGSYCLPPLASNQRVYYGVGSNTLDISKEFLVEFFVRPQWAAYGTFFEAYVSSPSSVQRIWLGFNENDDGKLLFYLNGATALLTPVITNLYDGEYKYMAIYKPFGSLAYSLYVDGALQGTTSFVTVSFDSVIIGNYSGGGYPANSRIDEFRMTVGGTRGAPTTIPTTAFPRG